MSKLLRRIRGADGLFVWTGIVASSIAMWGVLIVVAISLVGLR